jgi:hypothetical protein
MSVSEVENGTALVEGTPSPDAPDVSGDSEDTNTEANGESGSENAEPEFDREAYLESVDDIARALLTQASGFVNEHNTAVKAIKAAEGDTGPMALDMWRESDDPDLVSAREEYDALIAQAESIRDSAFESLKAQVTEQVGDPDALREKVADIRKRINGLLKYATDVYGEGWAKCLPDMADLRGAKGGGASAVGKGNGPARPRFSEIRVGTSSENQTPVSATVNGKQTVNLTVVAQKYGVKQSDLLSGYLQTANVEDWRKAPQVVEFAFTDKNNTTQFITVIKAES